MTDVAVAVKASQFDEVCFSSSRTTGTSVTATTQQPFRLLPHCNMHGCFTTFCSPHLLPPAALREIRRPILVPRTALCIRFRCALCPECQPLAAPSAGCHPTRPTFRCRGVSDAPTARLQGTRAPFHVISRRSPGHHCNHARCAPEIPLSFPEYYPFN